MTELFPTLVYALCFVTSAGCAWLLMRSYWRTGARLLLWSGACFILLAGNNLVVILDILVWPDLSFRLPRLLLSFAAVSVLLFGFIWDLKEAGE